MKWDITLDTKVLDALPKKVRRNASDAVQGTRAALAKEMRARAPVDEGELKGSIEEYEPGPTLGVVWVDAEHGIHIEYGTAHNPAQPFIRESARAVKNRFLDGSKDVFE